MVLLKQDMGIAWDERGSRFKEFNTHDKSGGNALLKLPRYHVEDR